MRIVEHSMYKAPQKTIKDFYDIVKEKEEKHKQGKPLHKSYFEYNKNGIKVRIPHDAVNHVINGHTTSIQEWEDALNNFLNIEYAQYSTETYSNDKVVLFRIGTPKAKYGCVLQYANGQNWIPTLFKSTIKGIDAWINKGSATSLTNNPSAPLGQNPISVVVSSQNLNFIINEITEKVKSPSEISNVKNIKEDFNDAFWKWFGNSKVVDEKGNPLVVYHGTKVDNIEIFKTSKVDKFEGIYFSDSYEVAATYAWAKPMPCYLSIKNPLVVDAKGENYWGKARDTIVNALSQAHGKYDGVIIKNIDDDAIQDGEGEIATTYIVFKPYQIKSVDNKGTWSTTSDNIYETLNKELEKYL